MSKGYESPFSYRYGSDEMQRLWSEGAKRRAWRRVWLAVAEAQAAAGLITPEQIDEIRAHAEQIDLERARQIEAEIGHDLMAELRTFAEQCPSGGGVLHWGLTSADVQDNADVLRQKAGLTLLLDRLRRVLLALAERIEETHNLTIMGFTHLQPAEPTTLGYRLAAYAQDLWDHFERLLQLRNALRGKGIRGAVGTAGPFTEMLAASHVSPETLEATAMQALGIEAHAITTQTYPRVQDFTLLAGLAGLAASLHKVAFDIRLMQSPGFRAAREPFGARQVGSSAMPFKRNPVKAEKICSLAREVASMTHIAWENAASSLLERTLDDSANRRTILPEAFLACDEMLIELENILQGMEIDAVGIEEQIARFGPFASLERVLTALVLQGADRQSMHERLREHSLEAWRAVEAGEPNPLPDLLVKDTSLLHYLQPGRLRELLDASGYTGLAPRWALEFAQRIRARLEPQGSRSEE